jgi:phosphoglucosamine mutase
MTRTYFGTDGIRGAANAFPMTPEVAMRVGLAAGKRFRSEDDRRHLVVIGKDTRLSGYMLEPALTAGFTAAGMDVVLFGPLPTPAVAMLTRSLRADLGVMLSASHNKFADNGIKLFGPDGYKLSDQAEIEIERLMDSKLDEHLAKPDKLGRARRIDDAQARYVEIVKATFPKKLTLQGISDIPNPGRSIRITLKSSFKSAAIFPKFLCEPAKPCIISTGNPSPSST